MGKTILDKWAHRTRRGMVITAPVGATLVIAIVVIIGIVDYFVWRYLQPNTPTEKKDFAQVAATLAAGIVLLGQMFLAGLNLQVTRDTANQKADSDREGQITERFTKAVEQLGNESMTIRFGGIYALESIASDSVKYYKAIIDLLVIFVRDRCDYSRRSAAKREYLVNVMNEWSHAPEQLAYLNRELVTNVTDIIGESIPLDTWAAVDVIGRRRVGYEVITGPTLLRFTGIKIPPFNFSGHFEWAGFNKSKLDRTSFTDANLGHAQFSAAVLDRVHFSRTILGVTDFTDTLFKDVTFEDTDLSRTHGLTQSQLDQCELIGHIPLPPGLYPPGGAPPGIPA